MYRVINFDKVTTTLSKLYNRINDRFPETGLIKVCFELQIIASETEADLVKISRPNYMLRSVVASIIVAALLLVILSVLNFDLQSMSLTFIQLVQVGESAINDVVLFSIAIFFLITLESRIKVSKVVKSLNELRAISHIIDMHQLTKDPTETGEQAKKTPSSPIRNISEHELRRYLDYCSEMLSIVGKIAAVYGQRIPENAILSAVNDIEILTSGISQKIWQKMMILQQLKHE